MKDALFVVSNGEARAVTEPPTQLLNGDFSAPLNAASGWKILDPSGTREAGAIHLKNPAGANARVTQTLKLRPFRQYDLTLRARTADFSGEVEAKILAGKRPLNFAHLGLKKTQDCTTHHVVFNSLDVTTRDAAARRLTTM